MSLITFLSVLLILNFGSSYGVIPTLYNTGVDNSHVSFPLGTTDIHWTISPTGPPAPITNIRPAWLPNTTVSSWISPGQGGQPTGEYLYTTTFDLTGYIVDAVSIDYRITMDDHVTEDFATSAPGIYLNGFVIPGTFFPASGAFNWTSWSPTLTLESNITSGESRFVNGVNTLNVYIDNGGAGPTGFRFEQISAITPVPEPSTYLILTGAMVALLVLARKKGLKNHQ